MTKTLIIISIVFVSVFLISILLIAYLTNKHKNVENLKTPQIEFKEGYTLICGGGALGGSVHLGVYETIFGNNFILQCIGGTSMGALISYAILPYIDEEGKIKKEGIKNVKKIFTELNSIEDFMEENAMESLLKTIWGDDFKRNMQKNLNIPFIVQVYNEDEKEREFKVFDSTNTFEEILPWVIASGRNNILFGMEAIEINGKKYSDDPSTWFMSTLPLIDFAKKIGVSGTIISSEISLIDFDFLKPMKIFRNLFLGDNYKSDTIINHLKGHCGEFSTKAINGKKFASTPKEAKDSINFISVGDGMEIFYELGLEASQKKL